MYIQYMLQETKKITFFDVKKRRMRNQEMKLRFSIIFTFFCVWVKLMGVAFFVV